MFAQCPLALHVIHVCVSGTLLYVVAHHTHTMVSMHLVPFSSHMFNLSLSCFTMGEGSL
jgi:hypothetical protein